MLKSAAVALALASFVVTVPITWASAAGSDCADYGQFGGGCPNVNGGIQGDGAVLDGNLIIGGSPGSPGADTPGGGSGSGSGYGYGSGAYDGYSYGPGGFGPGGFGAVNRGYGYGQGAPSVFDHGVVYPESRTPPALERGRFDPPARDKTPTAED